MTHHHDDGAAIWYRTFTRQGRGWRGKRRADIVWHRRPRRARFWPGRQHLRIPPRGCPSLALLLWRIRSGYTTEWDGERVLSLAERLDAALDAARSWEALWEAANRLADRYRALWMETWEEDDDAHP